MVTNGLVTVIQNGRVLMKIVAGSNGVTAKKVAEKIAAKPALARNTILMYVTALNLGFGCTDDLVVINPVTEFHKCDGDLGPLYRSTFNKPEFNPRWEIGIADYYEEVTL